MQRRHSDEYDDYAPLLAEFAALDRDDPRRAVLRDRLLAGFLPVAQHVARRFARRGEPLDDLEQVASIGLLNALERFDPGRGIDFLGYAVPTITGEVRRHFRDATWAVRTPRSVKERYVAVGTATTVLSRQLGRAPTSSELAEHLEIDREQVIEALGAHSSYRPASLDADLDEAGSALLELLPAGEGDLARVEVRAVLRRLMRALPERERRILVLRFVQDRTQAEIGAELCLSQMHVSRLLSRTVAALRASAREDGLLDDAPAVGAPAAGAPVDDAA